MKVPEMPAVLTIGHSNRAWKDFRDLSAGAPRQARHRRTQCPPIKTQPSVQPGDPVKKVAGR